MHSMIEPEDSWSRNKKWPSYKNWQIHRHGGGANEPFQELMDQEEQIEATCHNMKALSGMVNIFNLLDIMEHRISIRLWKMNLILGHT